MEHGRTLSGWIWYWSFKLFCELKHPRHPLLKLARTLVRRVHPVRKLPAPAVPGVPIPKKLWTFWAQGWEDASPLIKLCRDSWIVHNPDWEIHLLTEADIKDHVAFDYPIDDKHLTYTNYSNLLRLSLLAKEGGVWVDATTICTRPLDSWLPEQLGTGFFVYEKPKTTVADWIVAAVPHHPLIEEWRDYEYRYWRYAKNEWRYFWPHYIFEYLLYLRPQMRRLFERTPHVSSDGPYAAQRAFKRGASMDEFVDLLSPEVAPLHKLDWRMEVPEETLRALRGRLHTS